jgi:streptomycin 3"-adenylyltransferase
VFWYLRGGIISSKQEAGNWGLTTLPNEFKLTIQKVVNRYLYEKQNYDFDKNELLILRDYLKINVQEILD